MGNGASSFKLLMIFSKDVIPAVTIPNTVLNNLMDDKDQDLENEVSRYVTQEKLCRKFCVKGKTEMEEKGDAKKRSKLWELLELYPKKND
ncbi:hypothetical protein BLOT_014964 [Blomia tropicalis]|nr:hypothetical protein BLOT_014964 [Blomia tropicalis]